MAKIWEEHTCEICHKKFMTGSRRSKYCSPECSAEARRLRGQWASMTQPERMRQKYAARRAKLDAAAAQAKAHDMTYGQWIAFTEMGVKI